MGAAARMIGLDNLSLVSSNLERPAFIVSPEQREGIAAYFKDGWFDVDYRAKVERKLPLNTLFLDHRVIGEAERKRTAIYNDLFVPQRMAHSAGMRFDLDGREEWFCFAARGEDKGVIEGEDAANFVRIARTAMHTASLATRWQHSRAQWLIDALDKTGSPAIVLDRDGRVNAVTPAAERIFGADLGVRERRLWSANPDDAAALGALTLAARTPDAPLVRRRFLLRGRGRRRQVLVTVSCVLGPALDALPGGTLLLTLSDLGGTSAGIADELQTLFGLTLAEAQVAAAIFEGDEAADIAIARGVAETTVRKQIGAIFRKLDVHRQAELVRLLAGLKR
ncbi:MAG: hypothetical protein B7Y90_10155 [Alphaproteobacteria bacterium 32-64-14]|nr:MAG: hypothetical protein B7Y90_10155 [Alphaproteobacteria bacterium 32-64-14]